MIYYVLYLLYNILCQFGRWTAVFTKTPRGRPLKMAAKIFDFRNAIYKHSSSNMCWTIWPLFDKCLITQHSHAVFQKPHDTRGIWKHQCLHFKPAGERTHTRTINSVRGGKARQGWRLLILRNVWYIKQSRCHSPEALWVGRVLRESNCGSLTFYW